MGTVGILFREESCANGTHTTALGGRTDHAEKDRRSPGAIGVDAMRSGGPRQSTEVCLSSPAGSTAT
ncbi:hypothetical protein GCM10028775_58490 [Catellatospora paridis]